MENIYLDIRRMTKADITYGLRLKTIAGWNQTENDWRRFTDISPDGCFCAICDDHVVGTVATVDYGGKVSWIGVMLVDPEYRRRGIATRLMKRAVDHLSECESVKLDATPAGKEVYSRLGFREEYIIRRMIVDDLPEIETPSTSATPIDKSDLPSISGFDTLAFGADRMQLLSSLFKDDCQTAWKLADSGDLNAFSLGRHGTNRHQIGPVVGTTVNNAVSVTKAAMKALAGKATVIDVPGEQTEFLSWLESLGFTEERSLIRMFLGENIHPGQPGNVYAITGPEFG